MNTLTQFVILLSLVSLLFSCANVPDVPVCAEISPDKAFCAYTISNTEFYIDNNKKLLDKKTWSQVKAKSLIVPFDSWGKIKGFILKACEKSNDCFQKLPEAQNKINKIDYNLSN